MSSLAKSLIYSLIFAVLALSFFGFKQSIIPSLVFFAASYIASYLQDKFFANKTNGAGANYFKYKQMFENIPINVIVADLDGIITELNTASIATLRTIENLLPIKVDDIVGASYDVFHKMPSHQRQLLADPSNLPHQAIIAVGEEKLDLLVSPIYDEHNTYLGPMVTWSVVTEKLKLEEESNRYKQIVDNLPINLMLADKDSTIVSMNPLSMRTLKSIESLLPIAADDIIGSSYDVFHKVPSHQRQLLADPNNLPHQTIISLGEEKLDLMVSALYDSSGEYTGPMLTWSVVTDEINAKSREDMVKTQLNSNITVLSSSTGDLSSSSDELKESVNALTQNSTEVKQIMTDISAASEELASSIKEIATRTFEATDLTQNSVQQITSTQQIISALNEQSTEIESIVKTINEISSQTNLLALNATIEAARAGDVGKGFAVVAGEIKELAARTGQSTEEIRERVTSIQEATSTALESVQIVVESIQEVNATNTSIASAVEEQTAVTQEIERNMHKSNENIDHMVSVISSVESSANVNVEKVKDLNTVTADLSALTRE